jgi:hypothetical protein
MDPLTLATIALTLLATKATEKIGEKFGEGVLTEGGKLLKLMQRTSPDTVKRLAAAAADSTVIDAEIIEDVKADVRRVAEQEPEVKAAVAATAAAMEQAGGMTNINFGKAANMGIVLNQTNTF